MMSLADDLVRLLPPHPMPPISVRKIRHQRTTTKRSNPSEFVRILATGISAATLSLIVAPPARAIDATWTGSAATNVYNTAGNWDLNAAPTANGDNAIWNGLQAGPLDIIWNGQIGGFGGNGVNLIIASGQTDSIRLSNSRKQRLAWSKQHYHSSRRWCIYFRSRYGQFNRDISRWRQCWHSLGRHAYK